MTLVSGKVSWSLITHSMPERLGNRISIKTTCGLVAPMPSGKCGIYETVSRILRAAIIRLTNVDLSEFERGCQIEGQICTHLMRGPSYMVFAVAMLAMLLGVAVYLTSHSEPRFQGVGISEWLAGLKDKDLASKWGTDKQSGQDRAAEAIRHMGTNTLPVLLKMLRYKAI